MSKKFMLGFYELDRAYGGPEEGGWWYGCGQFARHFRTCATEEEATRIMGRANRLLARLARKARHDINSVCYSGGVYGCQMYPADKPLPEFFPERKPHYE